MTISKTILPEFDHEMANTRKTLERVPDDKFDWKPHEKSMTLGDLATHLATIPSWTKNTFEVDELDLAPPGQPPYRLEAAKSRAEVLEAFDKNVSDARAALEAATDENWHGKWSLLMTRQGDLHAAAHRRDARLHPEPFNSSSRTAWCVPSPVGYSRAVDLRTVGG